MPSVKTSSYKDKSKTSSGSSSPKTLTPQRKHRKLLKDGSSEVWPESVEAVFVEGLRQYWGSPWATYSRGRSRWRNQFLVDHLQKAGIERSKKQVASHIQVLRNMWKGEPEFHLVAGGEELFLETGLLAPVKSECDTNGLIPLDFDELSPGTPPSPGFSPTEYVFEHDLLGRSPTSPSNPPSPFSSVSPQPPSPGYFTKPNLEPPTALKRTFTGTLLPHRSSAHSSHPTVSSAPTSPINHDIDVHRPSLPHTAPSRNFPSPIYSDPSLALKASLDNRVCFVSLWAEGMLPFTVPTNGLTIPPISSDPMVFRIKLHLSSIDDVRCPPTLHGFHGTLSLAMPWRYSAQCITKVYASGACIAEEIGSLQLISSHGPASSYSHTVQAFLPESPLSRSRWLDSSLQTSISQQIIVDDTTLAFLIYDLDRREMGGAPSVQLLGIQRHRSQDGSSYPPLSPPLSPSSYFPTTNYTASSTVPFIPRSSRRTETSLSCALIPVNNLPSVNTSMLF